MRLLQRSGDIVKLRVRKGVTSEQVFNSKNFIN